MSNSARKTGCELWEDCETCPYPDCISGVGEKQGVILRRAEAIRLSSEGHNTEDIAKELGRSERQVKMYLKTAKT